MSVSVSSELFNLLGTFSTRISTRNRAKHHVPVETIWTVKCPFCVVLSNFLSHFHRVQDLGSDGILEAGGLIPLKLELSRLLKYNVSKNVEIHA